MQRDLAHKLADGDTVYGTCITSVSPHWPTAVANIGLDFVFIDTEHIPIDRAALTSMCTIYRSLQLSPIVRIPAPDPYLAVMAKDAGAVGVIMPYVETAAQVRSLIGATKLRPIKGQKLEAFLEGKTLPDATLLNYLSQYNPGSIAWINVESVAAVENLDVLLAVPGLDGVIIGPHDLSVSLGFPEQYQHPVFEKCVADILKRVRSAGLAAGIHYSGDIQFQQKWMSHGVNIVLHASDIYLFASRLRNDLTQLRGAGQSESGNRRDNTPVI